VLIAYLEGRQRITPLATLLIDGWIRAGRNAGVVSTVSAMELMVGPLRQLKPIGDLSDFLERFPNLACVELSLEDARAAASLRASTSLKTPDALLIGTAAARGLGAIVTNDATWQKVSPVRVITLDDFL
jgi:predicted nucleic acid-binding protein